MPDNFRAFLGRVLTHASASAAEFAEVPSRSRLN
jgi:hypothetical protein